MFRRCFALAAAITLAIVLLDVGGFPRSAGAEEPPVLPTSPLDIRPILIGSAVPDAAVEDLDGNPVSLEQVTQGKPTVLIFYRGGW